MRSPDCDILHKVPDHCANQAYGVDLSVGSAGFAILAPAPGYVEAVVPGSGGPCILFRVDDNTSLNICHFATTAFKGDPSHARHVARGEQLGTSAQSWVHLSLDDSYNSHDCSKPPIPFVSPHSLEGLDLVPADPADPNGENQYGTPDVDWVSFVSSNSLVVPTTSTPPRPNNTILYQADWSRGLVGWSTYYHAFGMPRIGGSGTDWQVQDGMLVNTGKVGCYCWSVLVSPFASGAQNYRIESEIQVLSEGDSRGVVVHDGAQGHYKVGSDRGYGAMISDFNNTPLAEQAFNHGGAWHRYRVEVNGAQIRFLIDDVERVVAGGRQYASGCGVGLWDGGGGVIRVRSSSVSSQ
jgi:hypothetical protein